MKRYDFALCLAAFLPGCNPAAVEDRSQPQPAVSRPVADPAASEANASAVRVSWDTDRDRTFARFLQEKSQGMIREAAVGIEQNGVLRIKLDRSVAPDDTLPLTNSIMAGARRDFPDRPITLGVFDPAGELILRAKYKVGQGVSYQLAGDDKTVATTAGEPRRGSSAPAPSAPPPPEAGRRSGPTAADRKFAEWALDHGKAYLRYVEADLERNGRLWFGVTREVKPNDVPDLTRSLLEGAHKEFPQGELTAVVFDPDGGKIGRASLGRDGSVRWDK